MLISSVKQWSTTTFTVFNILRKIDSGDNSEVKIMLTHVHEQNDLIPSPPNSDIQKQHPSAVIPYFKQELVSF